VRSRKRRTGMPCSDLSSAASPNAATTGVRPQDAYDRDMAATYRQTWLRRLGNVLITPLARLGLAGKGTLAPGADADLVIVAPTTPTVLAAADLRYRHRHSPYVGRTFTHRVERTILRGRTVWDGETLAPPTGRILRRSTPTLDR